MSIRLEITGDTADEVFNHLRALTSNASGGVMPEVAAHVAAKAAGVGEPEEQATKPAARKTKATKPAESATEPASSTSTQTSASADAARESSDAATSKASAEPEKTETPADLSYDSDVAPKVTDAVVKHGRDAVVAILDTFGVEKASQLETQDQWRELLNALADLG